MNCPDCDLPVPPDLIWLCMICGQDGLCEHCYFDHKRIHREEKSAK